MTPWDRGKLRRLREERALTQEQLAQEVGAHRVTIARLESGAREPGLALLQRIARVLDVPITEIMGMKRAFKVSASRTPVVYHYLYNVARYSLDQAKREERASFYFLMSAGVFAAFALEAYLNDLGREAIAYWPLLERLSPLSKVEVLSVHLTGAAPVWSRRPYQSVKDAFELRNTLAHGSTETVGYEDEVLLLSEDEDHPQPQTKWEASCDLETIERLVIDVRHVIEALAKAHNPETHPFGAMSIGEHRKGLPTPQEATKAKLGKPSVRRRK